MTKLIGVCNPLLDITATVTEEFLEKWNLKANDAILAEEKHGDLYKEVQANFDCTYSAGGSGQNTTRVAQWLLGDNKTTCFIGATSKDKYEETLKTEADKVGMLVKYFDEATVPTGTCAVLVTGHNRSMVANLSAANTYHAKHLDQEDVWKTIEGASVIYITGFFHTVSQDAILKLAEHCKATKKTLAMNLSAPFLLEVPFFFESFKKIEPYVDVYFGNEAEFGCLAKAYNFEGDLPKVLEQLAQLRTEGTRTVVMTQGAEDTVIVVGNKDKVEEAEFHSVIKVEKEEINDTNGCGDAFVGGFLAGLVLEKDIKDCVRAGNYCANVVIKHLGCDYPEKPEFTF